MAQLSENEIVHRLGRRAFLRNGALLLAGTGFLAQRGLWAAEAETPTLRVGLLTDTHYSTRKTRDVRHYQESLGKMRDAVKQFQREKVERVFVLGDLIDTASTAEDEKGFLRQVVDALKPLPGPHRCVVGNHCVKSLTKPEFLGIVGQQRTFDSCDAAGYHFVFLDACFRSDGQPYCRGNYDWTDANIPPHELDWLRDDLRKTPHKTIVCIHQCLDSEPPVAVKNRRQVRKVLEESGKVLAVLQGHEHKGNYSEINGIHYCTLQALVVGSGLENNAYAILDILPGDALRIRGFCRQPSYTWAALQKT